jgi:hypothetical protein
MTSEEALQRDAEQKEIVSQLIDVLEEYGLTVNEMLAIVHKLEVLLLASKIPIEHIL